MMRKIHVVDENAYYWCPVNDSGLNDIPQKFSLQIKRNPKRAVLVFDCGVCGERHAMTFTDGGPL
jgi:cephalosporin hydroxylase